MDTKKKGKTGKQKVLEFNTEIDNFRIFVYVRLLEGAEARVDRIVFLRKSDSDELLPIANDNKGQG
jgi:hypothetical protein